MTSLSRGNCIPPCRRRKDCSSSPYASTVSESDGAAARAGQRPIGAEPGPAGSAFPLREPAGRSCCAEPLEIPFRLERAAPCRFRLSVVTRGGQPCWLGCPSRPVDLPVDLGGDNARGVSAGGRGAGCMSCFAVADAKEGPGLLSRWGFGQAVPQAEGGGGFPCGWGVASGEVGEGPCAT